ncbi:MAG: gluconate transporter, partial [Bacteroidota bacterium]
FIEAPSSFDGDEMGAAQPPVFLIFIIILSPIFFILLATFLKSGLLGLDQDFLFGQVILFIGHPFTALTIANLLAWYLLGIRADFSKERLFKISQNSLIPAGSIILVTGAGGAFKQILVDTGTGKIMASALSDFGMPLLVFAFLAALLVRVIQGSATVAMITAAGLLAPLLSSFSLSDMELASLVIAIAAGASGISHVNDSGFWLVSQYLGLNEKETLRTWTGMTSLLAFSSFAMLLLLQLFF